MWYRVENEFFGLVNNHGMSWGWDSDDRVEDKVVCNGGLDRVIAFVRFYGDETPGGVIFG